MQFYKTHFFSLLLIACHVGYYMASAYLYSWIPITQRSTSRHAVFYFRNLSCSWIGPHGVLSLRLLLRDFGLSLGLAFCCCDGCRVVGWCVGCCCRRRCFLFRGATRGGHTLLGRSAAPLSFLNWLRSSAILKSGTINITRNYWDSRSR